MLGRKFCRKEQARRYLDYINTSERKTFHGLQQYCSIAFQLAQDLHVIVEARRAAGKVLATDGSASLGCSQNSTCSTCSSSLTCIPLLRKIPLPMIGTTISHYRRPK